ncbi:phage portal protein [Pseudacidovorax sp. NFM-22]|uniref:phage portal protein n=1 Tax=Pseudacidovorax sp. NFM-22 TaxID=2744469 RepID=UPI001F3C104B|nr:phage portal protein [Pseudacidovorax sp. NFM-22]
MSVSLFDRALATVAPGLAMRRAAALGAMRAMDGPGDPGPFGTQAGAAPIARRWWKPLARDARTDTVRELRDQRAKSRDLARTTPLAVGAINTNVDRIVGTGLALSAQPNRKVLGWSDDQAEAWRESVQNEFSMWADSNLCDYGQELNFYQQQALVLRSTLESGDSFTLMPDGERSASMPYALRLQLLEADRCGNPDGGMDTPEMCAGVRMAANGAPQAYFIYDQHPGSGLGLLRGNPMAGNWIERVGPSGRRKILHHYRKLRPEMPRGVPYLAPIVDCIKQLARFTEAEIMAAVISAYFTVFIETPGGSAAPVFDGGAPGEADGSPEAPIGLSPGAVIGLAPGEKINAAQPSRPNPNFDPFVQAIIKQIGIALSIPYEILVKQFQSSYSASKAALLDFWVYVRTMRFWLAASHCQPVYETWMAEAVAQRRIAAPGFFTDPLMRWAYTRAAWPGDSMGSINPKDEIEAYVRAIDNRLMTREQAEWLLWGTDWNQTFPLKAAEQKRLVGADLLPISAPGSNSASTRDSTKEGSPA